MRIDSRTKVKDENLGEKTAALGDLGQSHHGGLQLGRSGDSELAIGIWKTTTFIVRATSPG